MVDFKKEAEKELARRELARRQAASQPSFGGQVSSALAEGAARVLGAPVDVATSAINLATSPFTDGQLIDPQQQPGGSQFFREFGEGGEAGLRNVGRGIGIADPQTPEQRQFQRQRAEESAGFATGEIFTEVAPFITPATAIGRLSLIPRIFATGGLGATEGAIIAQGRGDQDVGESALLGGGLGVTFEALFPVLSRVASSVFRRIKGVLPKGQLVDKAGNATPELVSVLDEAGLTVDDLQGEVLNQVQRGADPVQAERAARFRTQGIPTTKGVITQDDVLLGREQTLLGRTDEAGALIADPIRQRRLDTSIAFQRNANEIIEDLGLPEQAGLNIKAALTQRRKLLTKEKNELYRLASEADPNLLRTPILTDNIADAVPDDALFNRINRLKPTESQATRDILIEFGIDQTPERVEEFLKKQGNQITPLNFNNFEDFRQGLNQIKRSDQTRTVDNLVRPIINSLDNELEVAFDAVTSDPNARPQTLELMKQARRKVRELKIEFDPDGTTGKLIGLKRQGNLPKVEASQVYKTLTGGGTSTEAVGRIVGSLDQSFAGRKAIGDLQASVVFDALDKSLAAVSNKSGGVQQFSAVQFVNQLNRLGDKVDIIFQNNPAMLKALRDLQKSARETVVPGTTLPKGSAPAVNAILGGLSQFRSVPVIKQVVDVAGSATQSRAALSNTPQRRKTVEFIAREYPALATVLGVGLINDEN